MLHIIVDKHERMKKRERKSKYRFVEHPRHGLVPCAVARVDVEEGEELFLHYGYDPLNCPR